MSFKTDFPKAQWTFVKFEPSRAKTKKYAAIIVNNMTGKQRRINFGARTMEHYEDTTGLGLYSGLDHGNAKRRKAYAKRHKPFYNAKYFSPAYFSWRYLWSLGRD